MMKRTRHTPEQVIRRRRDADWMLAEQKSIAEIAKQLRRLGEHVSLLAQPVRRDEGRRRQAPQGA